jgi:hypothetical protein
MCNNKVIIIAFLAIVTNVFAIVIMVVVMDIAMNNVIATTVILAIAMSAIQEVAILAIIQKNNLYCLILEIYGNFEEVQVYDFSNLDLQEEGNDNCYNGRIIAFRHFVIFVIVEINIHLSGIGVVEFADFEVNQNMAF